MSSSWDAYNSGTDEEGNWKQYHYHMRAGTGFSDSSDYLEGFGRNNPTHIHQTTYDEVMIDATFYEDSELSNFNYFDLKYQSLKTNLVLTTLAVNVNDGQLNQIKNSAIDFINSLLLET